MTQQIKNAAQTYSNSHTFRFGIVALLAALLLCLGLGVSSFAYADDVATPAASDAATYDVATADNEAAVADLPTATTNDGIATYAYPENGTVASDGSYSSYSNTNAVSDTQGTWVKNANGSWTYKLPNGNAATGLYAAGGKYYISDNNGIMYAKQWVKIGSTWYYATASGALQTGWLKQGSVWYYLDPANQGAMLDNTSKTIDGVLYAFWPGGSMVANSWCHVNGNYAGYASASGAVAQLGTYQGSTIFLNKSGWSNAGNGIWFYANASRGIATGWVKDNGTWYYLHPTTGIMQTGWQKVGGTWYYLKGSGAMATGWQKLGNVWYYLDPSSGAMATGTRNIDGKNYSFASSGAWIENNNSSMDAKAQGYASSTGYLILVDCSTNYVGIYTGHQGAWSLLHYWRCTSGASGSPTVKGQFTVQSRGKSFGNGYTCWYWTQFYGNYLFHSVLYNPGSMSSIQDGRLGINASHGCVRLALENAKWIYDTIPSGTKVVVY